MSKNWKLGDCLRGQKSKQLISNAGMLNLIAFRQKNKKISNWPKVQNIVF